MMKSESEAALTGDSVPPYLRAYGSTYRGSGRYGNQYNHSVGHEGDGQEEPRPAQREGGLGGGAGGGLFVLSRVLAALGVFVMFAVTVTNFSSRWTPGAGQSKRPQESAIGSGDNRYRGMFEEKNVGEPHNTPLTLVATNEYGEYDRRALAMYGLDLVIEPHRETKISVLHPNASSSRFYWLLVLADESGVPLENVEAEVDAKGGRFATVTLTEAGGTYALLVQQIRADGSVVSEGRATVSCKYVRREVRDLTEADRTAFFTAMREFYTVSLEEGKRKYGTGFANAKIVAAVHNSQNFCFHNGMHFLNAHASFDLWVERSLQMIDPTVSLVIWDFMLDAAHLGTGWVSSEIFGTDMFGSAMGSPENQFQISDGWFAGITSAYDPDDEMVDEVIGTNHNPYGFIDASANYQDVPGVIRTHSYCGLKGEADFAHCETFIGCFEANDNLYDWSVCMEQQVHASIHGMLGGGFDCNVDMAEFQAENPIYTTPLLTFALEYLLANKWPSNSLMGDYNECDESCVRGQSEPCGCTCTMDPFELSDDEVYDFMEEVLEALIDRSQGDRFIHEDASVRNELGFMQDGERLDDESTMLLLRQMMVIGCEPGSVGAMSTGSSPLDPIFWVLHPAFEKAQHILQLSPSYRDTYDFDWVDSSCDGKSGGLANETFPFSEQTLGFGESSEMLTNEEISEILYPANPKLPYLYDGFQKWGDCSNWDACPECTAAPRAGEKLLPAEGVSAYTR